MNKTKRNELSMLPSRSGRKIEDGAVAVTRQLLKRSGGEQTTAHFIDLTGARLPDRNFSCTVCAAVSRGDYVSLLFGQPKVAGEILRAMLVVNMTRFSISQLIVSMDKMSSPSFQEIMNLSAATPEAPDDSRFSVEPDQAAELTANIASVGVSGRETCLDFYHISPSEYAKLGKPNVHSIQLDPVVRVLLGISAFAGLLDYLKELHQHFSDAEKAVEGEP